EEREGRGRERPAGRRTHRRPGHEGGGGPITAASRSAARLGAAGPRNVLSILTDQHRTATLGCYGNPVVRTPHLDALAGSGTRFDRWYTPSAICTPARASVLTGYAPFRHKLLANYERNVGYQEDLPDGHFTFSQPLRDAGYNCGLLCNWHAGTEKLRGHYGFDGAELPGWHNPVDHPDYLAYLAERVLPPYDISEQRSEEHTSELQSRFDLV